MQYLINQFILKKTKNIFCNSYFNDLLAPIILLAFSNILLLPYSKTLKGKNIFIFIGICSIGWEFVTPIYKRDSVSDVIDIIMYIIGAIIYMALKFLIERGWKRNGKKH